MADTSELTGTTAIGGDGAPVTAADVHRAVDELLRAHPPARTATADMFAAQFDAGLAWVHFPRGLGGLGASPGRQEIVDERLRAAGVPTSLMRNPVGLGMAAPTVLEHGTPEQRARYLRRMFAHEIWCQLFSEPGAGSDLASLSTRATRDGDEWIVSGQKVWTSLGHVAARGILLARTDSTVPRHRGLTYFVVDMTAPGVEVRPLRQITGEAEFNEVFLTDVRIPDADRLGAVNDGWRVALTTLMNERVALGGFVPPRGEGLIGRAVDLWHDRPGAGASRRDTLAGLWVEAEVLRLMTVAGGELADQGRAGPEGSIAKLMLTELRQRIAEFSLDLLGEDGLVYGSYDLGPSTRANDDEAPVGRVYLRSRAHTVEGGTTEVMRNILAELVLGLPREPRPAPAAAPASGGGR
jgi:alkylation response protein AidB-like acyl-CoA dehydrogenase